MGGEQREKIRKILKEEAGTIIVIVIIVYSFVSLVILPINSTQKDIQSINENHIVHIQDDMEEIKDFIKSNEEEKKLIWMQIERTATMMEQHLSQ